VFLIVTIIMDIVALLFCVSAAFSSAQDAQVGLLSVFSFSLFISLSFSSSHHGLSLFPLLNLRSHSLFP
jgi:hypothetical protein